MTADVETLPRRAPTLIERARRSPVTFGLIALTILFYGGQVLSDALLGYDLVTSLGAKSNFDILNGQYWRLVTPIFVHGGAYHLLINMYSLYAIGPAVEQFYGRERMLIVYFSSAVTGSLLSVAFSPARSVGASGAIFGLLGALGGFLYLHRNAFGNFGRLQLRQIVMVALINLAIGFMPGIDNWGHLGGLIGGVALAYVLGPRYTPVQLAPDRLHLLDVRPFKRIWPIAIMVLGALIILTAIILTTI